MPSPEFVRMIVPDGADLKGAGIYRWSVDGQTYVGKASKLGSRLNEYLNNIQKIETGKPYRKSKPDGFRAVHRCLAQSKARGLILEWEVLECCPKGETLLMRERHWIRTLSPSLNGPEKDHRL